MATGNMFQGQARGKVGDVVFAVRDGKQVSRVRNRRPKNPKTNKQMLQRAVMATVLQAYSAGRIIFDHSFQGKSVGEKNQRAFLSKNAKLLRSNLAAEIEAGTAALNCNVAVVAPGAINPVPNEYMISEGTYTQGFFAWDPTEIGYKMPTALTDETVAQYAVRNGLVEGDIYTFVIFGIAGRTPTFTVNGVETPTVTYKPECQYPCAFGFMRLQVKNVSAVTSLASNATMATFFDLTESKNCITNIANLLLSEAIDVTIANVNIMTGVADWQAAIGCIRSRVDEDLRSTSFMHDCAGGGDLQTAGHYGIMSPYALQAWQQGTESLGDSDLILEGGDD